MALARDPEDLVCRMASGHDRLDVDWEKRPVLERLVEEQAQLAFAVFGRPAGSRLHLGRLGQQGVVDREQRESRTESLGDRGRVPKGCP